MSFKIHCGACREEIDASNPLSHRCDPRKIIGHISRVELRAEDTPIRYLDVSLTKRERFAMAAMQGLLAGPQCDTIKQANGDFDETLAKWSVDAADALIAELGK